MSPIDSIPKAFQEGFAKLLQLKDKELQELCAALEKTAPRSNPSDLAEQISPKVKTIPKKDVESIISSVGSLVVFQNTTRLSVDEIVENVSRVIQEGKAANIKFDADNGDVFKKRLRKLLSTKSLLYSATVADLITEFENVFLSARIVTDIRPVSDVTTGDSPKVALIIHNLSIHHQKGGERHLDFFVAMDSEDLQTLKKELEAAQKQEVNLRSLLRQTKIELLGSERSSQ